LDLLLAKTRTVLAVQDLHHFHGNKLIFFVAPLGYKLRSSTVRNKICLAFLTHTHLVRENSLIFARSIFYVVKALARGKNYLQTIIRAVLAKVAYVLLFMLCKFWMCFQIS
jgi:hypothetical protein